MCDIVVFLQVPMSLTPIRGLAKNAFGSSICTPSKRKDCALEFQQKPTKHFANGPTRIAKKMSHFGTRRNVKVALPKFCLRKASILFQSCGTLSRFPPTFNLTQVSCKPKSSEKLLQFPIRLCSQEQQRFKVHDMLCIVRNHQEYQVVRQARQEKKATMILMLFLLLQDRF